MKDDERAPVLAHLRFAAERDAYAGLDLAGRFARIEATNLWSASASVSGLGSEWDATAAAREEIAALLPRLGVGSILDAPCGDAGWIGEAVAGVDYTGADIVPALVARNRARLGETARRRFMVADLTRDPLPRAELILCRDCLVHLSFANIAAALANFRASGATWLLATTFPRLAANRDGEDGDWRGLNLQRAPFDWPAPAALIDERCAEAGGSWADKSLGLWRLADLPVAR